MDKEEEVPKVVTFHWDDADGVHHQDSFDYDDPAAQAFLDALLADPDVDSETIGTVIG